MVTGITDEIMLIEKAQGGDEQCRNALAEKYSAQLHSFIYRITLQSDLADDITQETILEMFKVLGKLDKKDRFWPWLRGIAVNKLKQNHRYAKTRKDAAANVGINYRQKNDYKAQHDGLKNLISNELQSLVHAAMMNLKPSYREVLSLRCYEEMPYSEIASVLDMSEFRTHVLFHRAKKALEKQLSKQGLKKSALLTAIIIFGHSTADSVSAATNMTITAATLKTAPLPALAATATTKSTLFTMSMVGVLAVGTATYHTNKSTSPAISDTAPTFQLAQSNPIEQVENMFYFYPEGTNGPVMIQNNKGDNTQCQWQNYKDKNLKYDYENSIIYYNNYRMCQPDLSVFRLPSDSYDLHKFLNQVEDKYDSMELKHNDNSNILIIGQRAANEYDFTSTIQQRHHMLDEKIVRFNRPHNATIVDLRDDLHKQGWTAMTVSGYLSGEKITGQATIPFTYADYQKIDPVIQIAVGENYKILGNHQTSFLVDKSTETKSKLKSYAAFKYMPRPWQGLHTLDVVRRDLATDFIDFNTSKINKDNSVIVTAETKINKSEWRIHYYINMEKDWLNQIVFEKNSNLGWKKEGQLNFNYTNEHIEKFYNDSFIHYKQANYKESESQIIISLADSMNIAY